MRRVPRLQQGDGLVCTALELLVLIEPLLRLLVEALQVCYWGRSYQVVGEPVLNTRGTYVSLMHYMHKRNYN